MKDIFSLVFTIFLIGILIIPGSFAQDIVPPWIKQTSGWWADDKIDDFTFANAIGFLIKNKVIQIHDLATTSDGEILIDNDLSIPAWIKNNAKWWADDKITDNDFLFGIKFLVESNIIQFQSVMNHDKAEMIGKALLGWDTIVNDSKYAYDGSMRLQDAILGDSTTFTIKFNASNNQIIDVAVPTFLESGVWLYQITGDEKFLQKARQTATEIQIHHLSDNGVVLNVHPYSPTFINEHHSNQDILSDVAKLALVDSTFTPLTKILADEIIENEINHETELFYSSVSVLGEPLDRSMDMSYRGSGGLESLLLAYEVSSDTTYLEQVKRTILAYWDLRDKDTDLIPSRINADSKNVEDAFMEQYGAGIFLKILLHYYYLTEDEQIYRIIEDYTDAIVDYYWDGKTWNYRINYDGTIFSNIIEGNYGKLDDALFLVYDLNPSRFSKVYDLAKSDFDLSFKDKASLVNGLVTHALKDNGSPESPESMMQYAFIINQNPTVRLYHDTTELEYIEDMKNFYQKIISEHKRELGYIYGVDAYTLNDTFLGEVLNQRAVGMIGNKINLSFVPSDNVKIVWTKIGNFEITEPFVVNFNEPGRFNAIKFDYNQKSIMFETIENRGTVTFSGSINHVLVDGESYSDFKENTLNTLEGRHTYKVTLLNY